MSRCLPCHHQHRWGGSGGQPGGCFGLLNHEIKARKTVMDTVSSFIPQIQVVALIDSFIHLHLYDILADVIVPFQGGGVWFPLFNQNCHFYLSFLMSGGLPRPVELVVAVVIDCKPSVTPYHKAVRFSVSVGSKGVRKGQTLEEAAAPHQAANNVAAVRCAESHDSCNLYHFCFLPLSGLLGLLGFIPN